MLLEQLTLENLKVQNTLAGVLWLGELREFTGISQQSSATITLSLPSAGWPGIFSWEGKERAQGAQGLPPCPQWANRGWQVCSEKLSGCA